MNFDVRFSAAFGQGAVQVIQSDGGARLVDSTGDVLTGPNAEQLLLQRVGWRVPVEQLSLWLIGHPGNTDDYTLNRSGLLSSARLDGWTVEIPTLQ